MKDEVAPNLVNDVGRPHQGENKIHGGVLISGVMSGPLHQDETEKEK